MYPFGCTLAVTWGNHGFRMIIFQANATTFVVFVVIIPHDEAIAALAVCPAEERTPAATECSLILRRYLVALTGDPALFETHEEWVSRHDAIENLDADLQQQTRSLFSQLAEWKYAPADHGDEPSVVIEHSRNLLEALNREAVA